MKILYIITGLGLGGAEKVVADLADQMILRGHDVKIAYLTGDILVRPTSGKIEIIYLGLNSGINFWPSSKKYRRLITTYQPDVVHAHMVHANIFARLNRICSKIPKLICTAHNSNEGGKFRMLAYKYTNFLSDFNSNVSQEATQSFIDQKAFHKKNLKTIYNGIDLRKFKKDLNITNMEKTSCLSVGRFNDQKDYPNLLHAIAIIKNKISNIHFQIVGDGELRPNIERLIEELELKEYVSLLGRRNDIPALMSQADYFILPSSYEGFGLVVAEAMACETFVIATDCGGVKEVMGGHGILVPPKNSIALAEAIIRAINISSEEKENNNKAAKEHIHRNFDLDSIIDQWIQVYESK